MDRPGRADRRPRAGALTGRGADERRPADRVADDDAVRRRRTGVGDGDCPGQPPRGRVEGAMRQADRHVGLRRQRRPVGIEVVARAGRARRLTRAVGVHDEDLVSAGAFTLERDLRAVRRPGRCGVIDEVVRYSRQAGVQPGAAGVDDVDLAIAQDAVAVTVERDLLPVRRPVRAVVPGTTTLA